MSNVIESWHRILRDRDFDALDTLLDEKVVFHSPVVHTPQEGKAITTLYLKAAFGVLGGSTERDERERGEKQRDDPNSESGGTFRYVREVVGENDAVLEFMTEMDGIVVNGVDLIRWNDEGRIVDFKVMIRPLKAINKVHGMMAGMLERMKPA
jgi:hypothetical protein